MTTISRRSTLLALSAFLTVLMLPGIAAHAQNEVTNPGFETGSFSGWNVVGLVNESYVVGNFYTPPHSGNYQAVFGNTAIQGDTTISQVLATTAGAQYDVSFWLSPNTQPNHAYGNHFIAEFAGQTLINGQLPDTPYTLYHFTVTATGSQSTIRLGGNDPGGGIEVDDVNVSAVTGSTVPEGSSLSLLAGPAVLGGLWFIRRLRRRL